MKNMRTFFIDGESLKIFTYENSVTEIILSDSKRGRGSSVKIWGEIFDYDRLLIVERPYTLMYLNDSEMYDVWLEKNHIDIVTRERIMALVNDFVDTSVIRSHDSLTGDYEDVAYVVREILLRNNYELKDLLYTSLEFKLIGIYI